MDQMHQIKIQPQRINKRTKKEIKKYPIKFTYFVFWLPRKFKNRILKYPL